MNAIQLMSEKQTALNTEMNKKEMRSKKNDSVATIIWAQQMN